MTDWKKIKPYLKAQYIFPLLAFFIIFIYTFYEVTGSGENIQKSQNTFNRGSRGYFYFYKLFKELDYKFKRWYKKGPPPGQGCMVYFDFMPGDEKKLEPLLEWVKKGNILFMVGLYSSHDPVFIRRILTGQPEKIIVSLEVSGEPLQLNFFYGRHLDHFSFDDILISSNIGALLMRRPLGQGMIYIFPDNYWFSNRGFHFPDHAVLLNGVFKVYFDRTFYLYEYDSGTGHYRVNNPVMIFFKGHFQWLTYHLLFIGLVYVLWKSRRFGSPLHAELYKRHSLSVHLEAVGYFYQKARAPGIADKFLKKYFIYRLKQFFNIKRNLTTEELLEEVDHYTGKALFICAYLLRPSTGIGEKLLMNNRKRYCHPIADILQLDNRYPEKKQPAQAQPLPHSLPGGPEFKKGDLNE